MNRLEYISTIKKALQEFTSLALSHIQGLGSIDDVEFELHKADYISAMPIPPSIRDAVVKLENCVQSQGELLKSQHEQVQGYRSALHLAKTAAKEHKQAIERRDADIDLLAKECRRITSEYNHCERQNLLVVESLKEQLSCQGEALVNLTQLANKKHEDLLAVKRLVNTLANG